jgi:hypothetical protein
MSSETQVYVSLHPKPQKTVVRVVHDTIVIGQQHLIHISATTTVSQKGAINTNEVGREESSETQVYVSLHSKPQKPVVRVVHDTIVIGLICSHMQYVMIQKSV